MSNEKKIQKMNFVYHEQFPLLKIEKDTTEIVCSVSKNLDSSFLENSNFVLKKSFRIVDLFAGVGGIRLGFENAGFKTVFANDLDHNCAVTYNYNFKKTNLTVEDIKKISTKNIPDCEFIAGGFPCQAFSIAGYRQGFNDEKGRGNLFFEIIRLIKDKRPTGFLLENVKNLINHNNGTTYQIMEKTLKDLGYHIKSKIMNSVDYGNVPQNRERVYIVGFQDIKKIENFEFPKPIFLTKKVTDLLDEIVDKKYYYNYKPLYDRLKSEVNDPEGIYQWRRKYVRKNKKNVCPTLTANMGMGGHNVPIIYDGKGVRKLTPRECFRIQGFPESFKLPKISDSVLYKQAGNSVTVPVIERIAEQILRVI